MFKTRADIRGGVSQGYISIHSPRIRQRQIQMGVGQGCRYEHFPRICLVYSYLNMIVIMEDGEISFLVLSLE